MKYTAKQIRVAQKLRSALTYLKSEARIRQRCQPAADKIWYGKCGWKYPCKIIGPKKGRKQNIILQRK